MFHCAHFFVVPISSFLWFISMYVCATSGEFEWYSSLKILVLCLCGLVKLKHSLNVLASVCLLHRTYHTCLCHQSKRSAVLVVCLAPLLPALSLPRKAHNSTLKSATWSSALRNSCSKFPLYKFLVLSPHHSSTALVNIAFLSFFWPVLLIITRTNYMMFFSLEGQKNIPSTKEEGSLIFYPPNTPFSAWFYIGWILLIQNRK